ncbi:MAG: hypothetical protein CEO22_500 [Candidatus Berkelbacteria bacterium Gr01-1014_85]|uniref:Protein TolB n=1 Tax=Candidatus Berkelbacteria bacterium Gr01-1014_85 TaxID=2017150 RepID=A0A554JAJ4_9BACT|nr:MAG: hypothetical protein CEO22_500 [Candidatus Berkelbacteria bacterium Gr01-1014_85]
MLKNGIQLAFIAALVGLAWLIVKKPPQPIVADSQSIASQTATDQSTNSETSDAPILTPSLAPSAQGGSLNGKLYLKINRGQGIQINEIDLATNQNRVLVKSTATERIIDTANLQPSSDSLVYLLETDSGTNLMASGLKSGQSSRLIENFIATEAPALSPDSSQLAFTSFTNAEPNVGFTLYTASLNGQNRQKLLSDNSGISRVSYHPNKKELLLFKGSTKNNQLISWSLLGKAEQSIYQAKNQTLIDYGLDSTGLIALSKSQTDNIKNGSELLLIDRQKNSEIKLITSAQIIESPTFLPGFQGLAYLEKSNQAQGQLKLIKLDGQPILSLEHSAEKILGISGE